MKKSEKYIEFENRKQWRNWLNANHAIENEVFLVIFKKKYSQLGMTLEEATEEALCFGWIDSTLTTLDKKRYILRYSPRTSKSIWSMNNIQRVKKLITQGKMTDAGMKKISEAKENGQWQAAIRREKVDSLPKELEKALEENGLLSSFQDLPRSKKKRFIYVLENAKRDETKQRRITTIIDELIHT